MPALQQAEALGEKSFELDGPNLRTVLFLLGFALPVFIIIQLALDAVDLAVEDVDHRPQDVLQVGFKPRVAERPRDHIKNIRQRAAERIAVGQGAGVWLVLMGTPALHLQFLKDAGGR